MTRLPWPGQRVAVTDLMTARALINVSSIDFTRTVTTLGCPSSEGGHASQIAHVLAIFATAKCLTSRRVKCLSDRQGPDAAAKKTVPRDHRSARQPNDRRPDRTRPPPRPTRLLSPNASSDAMKSPKPSETNPVRRPARLRVPKDFRSLSGRFPLAVCLTSCPH